MAPSISVLPPRSSGGPSVG
uniref:60S ribosomal protein L13a-4 n=1 Tax=Rhizophora mucronata TaxID=61149 RepID=A0A2P2NE18_RHIMU